MHSANLVAFLGDAEIVLLRLIVFAAMINLLYSIFKGMKW